MTELRQVGPALLAAHEGQLEIPGVEVTKTSLRFLDPDLPFETWEQILYASARIHSAAKWYVGDALSFGETAYGERYSQALDATGLAEQTLTNWASVCRRVARSRRRENLRFSHHEAIAALEPQEQTDWLDQTEQEGWSVRELRERVREFRSPSSAPGPRWTEDEPVEPARDPDEVDEAEDEALRTLANTLPDQHPLWRTQAEARARDVRRLAPPARDALSGERVSVLERTRAALLADAVRRLVDAAEPIEETGFRYLRVPAGLVDELADLASPDRRENDVHD